MCSYVPICVCPCVPMCQYVYAHVPVCVCLCTNMRMPMCAQTCGFQYITCRELCGTKGFYEDLRTIKARFMGFGLVLLILILIPRAPEGEADGSMNKLTQGGPWHHIIP